MEVLPVNVMAGENITRKNDPLKKITVDYLYHAIKKPRSEIAAMINNLRTVQTIDPAQYRELKKRLPYVVCAIFNPRFRRTENFAYSNCFILDMDHLHQKESSPATVKEKIRQDRRVLMAFVSPGGDGLKILFRIDRKITDAGIFMMFYKSFAEAFARQYHLDQVVDRATSDVTRACFISFDPELLYNPDAEPVVFDRWFNESDGTLPLHAKKIMEDHAGEKNKEKNREEKEDLSPDLYAEIRKTLNPNARVKAPKQIYVPEEMEKITGKVTARLNDFGLGVREVVNIHYGKKFIITHEHHFAEINVFYGKRGFTVVRSMKKGSHNDLLEAGFAIISDFFYGKDNTITGLIQNLQADTHDSNPVTGSQKENSNESANESEDVSKPF